MKAQATRGDIVTRKYAIDGLRVLGTISKRLKQNVLREIPLGSVANGWVQTAGKG